MNEKGKDMSNVKKNGQANVEAEVEVGKSEEEVAELNAALEVTMAEDAATPPEKIVLPEDVADLASSQPELVYADISQFDFNPKLNCRDETMYGDKVTRKVAELLVDRKIKDPLHAVLYKGMAWPGDKPLGARGFIRSMALRHISIHHTDVYNEYFANSVPVFIHKDVTERFRTILMADHGSEEPLTELEVYNSQKAMMRQVGLFTEGAIARILYRQYYTLMSVGDRRGFMEGLTELEAKGMIFIGKTKILTKEAYYLAKCRGRLQYFKRIFTAPQIVEDMFIKSCRGEPGGVHITFAMAENLSKSTAEQAAVILANAAKVEKEGKQTEKSKHWGKDQLTNALSVAKSDFLKNQLEAALGNEKAQEKLPVFEDELIRIEKAKDADPAKFWACVDAILDAIPVPTPLADAAQVEVQVTVPTA